MSEFDICGLIAASKGGGRQDSIRSPYDA